MLAYTTGERDGTDEDQPEHESIDDQYSSLQDEIPLRDKNTATMTVKNGYVNRTTMENIRSRANIGASAFPNLGISVIVHPRATTSSNPQRGSIYDLTAFSPL